MGNPAHEGRLLVCGCVVRTKSPQDNPGISGAGGGAAEAIHYGDSRGAAVGERCREASARRGEHIPASGDARQSDRVHRSWHESTGSKRVPIHPTGDARCSQRGGDDGHQRDRHGRKGVSVHAAGETGGTCDRGGRRRCGSKGWRMAPHGSLAERADERVGGDSGRDALAANDSLAAGADRKLIRTKQPASEKVQDLPVGRLIGSKARGLEQSAKAGRSWTRQKRGSPRIRASTRRPR